MDESTERLLQGLIRRIPAQMLRPTLERWGKLTQEQLQAMDFKQPKSPLTEDLIVLFQENGLGVKHVTELEMIHVIDGHSKGMWRAFQLCDAEDDAPSIDLAQFKEQFKAHLVQLIRHVSIKIKKHTDEAVWIRIAWGNGSSRPNHLRPTYVVHHLQTAYVFVTNINAKCRLLLNQALVLATRHGSIKDANLSGHKLGAIRDLVLMRYQQVFPTMYPKPLQEHNPPPLNPWVQREQAGKSESRLKAACEAFGDGPLPPLHTAVYQMETRFKDNSNNTMTRREEPFRAVVKFSSTNILESLRHCVSSGICSAPVTPLLSSITQKGKNYFVVADNHSRPPTHI